MIIGNLFFLAAAIQSSKPSREEQKSHIFLEKKKKNQSQLDERIW